MSPMLALAVALLTFDPSASARALSQAEARTGALQQLVRLGRLDLDTARKSGLGVAAAMVANDSAVGFTDRVLGVRAAALLGGEPVPGLLAPLVAGEGDPETVALAREAARALRQLGQVEHLQAALGANDPEVRAHAASAGAGGESLCALVQGDPWVAVRVAAARGLSKHPEVTGCLASALGDRDGKVQLAAVTTAVAAPSPALAEPLRALAGNPKAPVSARAEAFVALGHLGDLEPARKALALHLDKGGIVPLAEASVRALAAGDAPPAELRAALKSEAAVVQVAAARSLVARGDQASLDALRILKREIDPRRRQVISDLIDRLEAPPALGETIADPEAGL